MNQIVAIEIQPESLTLVDIEPIGAPITVEIATAGAAGPPGEPGPAGEAGADGPQGPPGVGLPVAGTTGQILAKASAADYDTEWKTVSGVGGATDWADITGKPATFPPTVPIAWADISGEPATYPPDPHSHAYADITGKPATFPPTLPIAQSGVTNLVTDLSGKAPTVHTHTTAQVTGLDTALSGKEPSLPAGGTTSNFLRGDKTWAAPAGGGIPEAPTDGQQYGRVGSTASWTVITGGGGSDTAAQILTKLLTVDGAGSLLDADLLDGQSSAFYATASSVTGKLDVLNGTLTGYTDVTSIATPATPSTGRTRLYAGTSKGLDALGYLNSLGIPMVMARDRFFYARNTTGSTLTKGTAVYLSGATGGTPLVAKAQANPTPVNVPCVGLVAADIANNTNGAIMASGVLSMDTSAWAEGAKLYLSATVAGTLTTTMPVHPNITQTIAMVEVSGVGNGSLLVNVLAINPHEYDGVNGLSWSIGDATGTTKSLLMKNAAGTGTLSWNPTANRTLTLPDATATLATTTDLTTKLDSSAYTAADVLAKIKTVDSTGSGLDADLLDAQSGTYYLDGPTTPARKARILSPTEPPTRHSWRLSAPSSPASPLAPRRTLLTPPCWPEPTTQERKPVSTVTGLGTAAVRNIHVGTTAPGSPATNDIWIDTT